MKISSPLGINEAGKLKNSVGLAIASIGFPHETLQDKAVKLDKNIDAMKDFGVDFFLQRRELGMINIGGDGIVVADGKKYEVNHYDALYLGAGTKEVTLESKDTYITTKEFNLFNIGWHVGGGAEWTIAGNTKLLFELTYLGSFLDLDRIKSYKDDKSEFNPELKFNDISLKVGVIF